MRRRRREPVGRPEFPSTVPLARGHGTRRWSRRRSGGGSRRSTESVDFQIPLPGPLSRKFHGARALSQVAAYRRSGRVGSWTRSITPVRWSTNNTRLKRRGLLQAQPFLVTGEPWARLHAHGPRMEFLPLLLLGERRLARALTSLPEAGRARATRASTRQASSRRRTRDLLVVRGPADGGPERRGEPTCLRAWTSNTGHSCFGSRLTGATLASGAGSEAFPQPYRGRFILPRYA